MAVTFKKNIWFFANSSRTAPPKRTYQMAASQGVLMPGAPLELNASGLCELSDDSDTQILGYLEGVVDGDTTWPLTAALSLNAEVRVAIAREQDIWAIYASTTGDADAVIVQGSVGTIYEMAVHTIAGQTPGAGYVTLNVSATAGPMYRVVDLMANREPSKHSTADSPSVVLVTHSGTLQG